MKENVVCCLKDLLVVASEMLCISCHPGASSPQTLPEGHTTPIVLYSYQTNEAAIQIVLNHNQENSFLVDFLRKDGLHIIIDTHKENMLPDCSFINNY